MGKIFLLAQKVLLSTPSYSNPAGEWFEAISETGCGIPTVFLSVVISKYH